MDRPSSADTPAKLSSEAIIQLSKNARRFYRNGEYARACELYRQGLESDPRNPYLLSGLGDACREAGDLTRARAAYQSLLDKEPDNLFALRGLGDLCKDEGAFSAAVGLWKRYLGLRPQDVYVMMRLADAYKGLDQLDLAEELYRQILELAPQDTIALSGLADLLHGTGRDLEAIACYEKILTLRKDVLQVLTIVGKLCWRVNDYEKSKRFFLLALDIDPDNPYALYGLGNCYRWQRDYRRAVETWQRILRHNSGTINLYSRLGDALGHLGELDEAEESYRLALGAGYDRYAKIGLIKLCCDRGEFSRAVEELNDLLANETDPWQQINELSQRFVRAGRRESMLTFYHHLLESRVPNCIDPRRLADLIEKLEA
jgi:tetratricopeptide (TPR) repeat protein